MEDWEPGETIMQTVTCVASQTDIRKSRCDQSSLNGV